MASGFGIVVENNFWVETTDSIWGSANSAIGFVTSSSGMVSGGEISFSTPVNY